MALGLGSNQEVTRANEVGGIRVSDTIPITGKFGGELPPGLVAVLDGFLPANAQSYVGKMSAIRTESGGLQSARIGSVEDHGKTISFYYEGLTRSAIPIGSYITVED